MKVAEQRIATSVLVVGSGGSGLRAAIQVAERGADVLVVGKRPAIDAHTTLAAGGINAALGTMDPEDSWPQHAADTLKEGYFLADPQTVCIVAEGAARGIADLERWGMPFAREADGRISQRFFGAHTFRRTAFAGDYTGLEIQRTLLNRVRRLGVPIIDTMHVTRVLTRDGAVFGAYAFDTQTGTRYTVHADAVILAAGGHTRIWRRSSSRRDENTGDSFGLTLSAGGRIRDPELVQFHPSGLLAPEDAAGTLVSEAARGEGGILRNGLGERFMQRYDPARLELSTRDRVALAVYTEIKEGRGTANGGVWLDVSHLPRQTIMQRLPRVYRTLLELQMLDITTTPIEIAPTAHYSMGGVWVRPEDHSTGVEGLYAVGEASSGLHGANRLGGNSLIELLVYGRIVGDAAVEYSGGLAAQQRSAVAVADSRDEVDRLLAADGPENVRATATRGPRHDDRARGRRSRRGRPEDRARTARRHRGSYERPRRAPRPGRLPGPRPCLRPPVVAGRRSRHCGRRDRTPRDARLSQPLGLPEPGRVAAGQHGLVRTGKGGPGGSGRDTGGDRSLRSGGVDRRKARRVRRLVNCCLTRRPSG